MTIIWAAACPVWAQPRPLESCVFNNMLFLKFHGAIDDYSRSEWNEKLSRSHFTDVKIFLDSNGGQLKAFPNDIDSLSAEDILSTISEIKRNGTHLTAVLRPQAKCRSACTLILAAVNEVYSNVDAVIGFHAAWRPKLVSEGFKPPTLKLLPDTALTNWYLNELIKLGIDPLWVVEQKDAGTFSGLQFKDYEPTKLQSAGFVTHITILDVPIPCEPLPVNKL